MLSGTGSAGQGKDPSEHWEGMFPAAGAQGGHGVLLSVLPHLHTPHVNRPGAAPPQK